MKKVLKVPNLERIVEPTWEHKPGYGISSVSGRLVKREYREQASTPEDPGILGKLGINKGEKVLAIAGYYASWASGLAKAGAKVTYSDISRSMVDYAKRNLDFLGYICSNYEFIPKEPKKYDWTFTFEACGGRQGLMIAYLRSLLNNKGGMLVLCVNREYEKAMGSKPKTYPWIVNALAEVYGAKSSDKTIKVKGHRLKKPPGIIKHKVYTIRTNDKAREKACLDLKVLDYVKGRKRVIDLEKDSKELEISEKELEDSVIRLSRITKFIKDEFLKKLEVRT